MDDLVANTVSPEAKGVVLQTEDNGSDSIKDLNSPDFKKMKTDVFEYKPASQFAVSLEAFPLGDTEKRADTDMAP